ncbi:MAG: DUF3311 domain-containing protein [Candidatus Eremiobacteraeota bacterium]|nr:DUF3311 domain-containing protein [Candidatus Eremiobacteraeota bacterium]
MRRAPVSARRRAAFMVAAVPALMLTFGVPLANRIEPRVFGFPFLLAWIVAWILLTPVFLYAVYRLEGRR